MIHLDDLHGLLPRYLGPLARQRGGFRVCRAINRQMLSAGASPIKIATMSDGTRMSVDLRSQTEWFAFYSGCYDDGVIALIRRLMMELRGDFLDVGSNIGMYAVRLAAVLRGDGRAICFEPMPDNARRIRENAALNGLEARVTVHEVALSDCEGEAELVLREDFEMGSATGNASLAISEEADGTFRRILVRTRRLDEILAEVSGRMPVAKVDIEGHEDCFLKGARHYIDRDQPIIFSEINNWFYHKRGTTSSEVFRASLPPGYSAARLKSSGREAVEWISLSQLAGFSSVENVVFCPDQKRATLEAAVRAPTRHV